MSEPSEKRLIARCIINICSLKNSKLFISCQLRNFSHFQICDTEDFFEFCEFFVLSIISTFDEFLWIFLNIRISVNRRWRNFRNFMMAIGLPKMTMKSVDKTLNLFVNGCKALKFFSRYQKIFDMKDSHLRPKNVDYIS